MRMIKLTPAVAEGLEAYNRYVYEMWRAQQSTRRDIGVMESLGLSMTAKKLTGAYRGVEELRASGELAATIQEAVVGSNTELASPFGAEMLRQYARTVWSFYWPPEGADPDAYEARFDTWQAAIDAAREHMEEQEDQEEQS